MATSDDQGLTEREIEVLKLIAQGYADKQIAEKLCITEGTVHRHIHNILTKLGVSNRTEATLWAVRKGLVNTDDCSGLKILDRL